MSPFANPKAVPSVVSVSCALENVNAHTAKADSNNFFILSLILIVNRGANLELFTSTQNKFVMLF